MADLGPAGQAFYDALEPTIKAHADATRPLLVEAARMVDRLNGLDDVIAGHGVLDLLRFRLTDSEGRVAEVKFDGVMSEARNQQATFATLVRALLPNLEAGVAEKARDPLDDLAARRAARGGATARPRRTAGDKG